MSFIAGVLRHAGDASHVFSAMLERSGRERASWKIVEPSPDLAIGVSLVGILPEDSFDRQPLFNDRFVLIGDIRIDNRSELAAKLGLSTPLSAEMADSNLFLSAWSAWEQESLRHIIGAFAVAIWDKQERELILIRDHCGERPLYYLSNAHMFAFSSLPRTLRAIPDVETGLNEEHLLNYLAIGPDSSAETYFKNILQLRPGHLLKLRHREAGCHRYWHPQDHPPIRLRSNEEYVEALLERFDAAVKARLRTNGKVGSQLSGGMDSSSVTATAARLLGPTRLTAFTAVPQPAFANLNPFGRFGDEGPAAARVAAMYPNIDHVLVEPSHLDLIRVIEETGKLTDAPVFNPLNQMWLNAILDEARARGINVMLQGACGNATVSFGGLIGLSELLRSGRWITLLRQVRALRSKGHTSWRGAAYWAAGYSLPLSIRKRLSPEMRGFDFSYCPAHPDRAREHHLRERAFQEFFASDSSSASFRGNMFDYFDVGFANAGVDLGWEISMRDPMQDKRVFEFCLSIPIEQYLAEGQSRSLVRRAMRDRLPAEILSCTTRGLQAADWYLTMASRREEMTMELSRIAKSPLARHLLDIQRLQRLLENWPDAGYEQSSVSDSWHLALSRGLSLGNFIRQFEDAGNK